MLASGKKGFLRRSTKVYGVPNVGQKVRAKNCGDVIFYMGKKSEWYMSIRKEGGRCVSAGNYSRDGGIDVWCTVHFLLACRRLQCCEVRTNQS